MVLHVLFSSGVVRTLSSVRDTRLSLSQLRPSASGACCERGTYEHSLVAAALASANGDEEGPCGCVEQSASRRPRLWRCCCVARRLLLPRWIRSRASRVL